MNIYEKLQAMRVELQASNLKKSGYNKFANFKYFTLEDLLPKINELLLKYKLFSVFSIISDLATLKLINSEKADEVVEFYSPIADADIKGCTPVQCLGGVHTYVKRYLYSNAFEVVEGEVLDALIGSDKLNTKKLDNTLIKQLSALNISLEQIATYKQVSVDKLTDEDLKEILRKKQAMKEVK